MILLNFEKWSHSAGRIFSKWRIYNKKGKWTPFIRLTIRYKPWYKCLFGKMK